LVRVGVFDAVGGDVLVGLSVTVAVWVGIGTVSVITSSGGVAPSREENVTPSVPSATSAKV
jgi:hypothetical protein